MKTFGVMLDVSRNGVMKPQEVKNFAKILSSFGYNMLQLYTEDTYKVDNEPYFGYMRGSYTKEELKDIVAYCASIGVEVVPCVQTLAHLNQIFYWEPYKKINDFGDILLAAEERTYALIENMFKTLRECYTTKKIHLGMDEAHMLGLGKYLDKHGYCNRFDILLEHLNKVLAIAKKYDFQPIMWSDMFFRLANHGEYAPHNKNTAKEMKDKTPTEVGLVYWDYYRTNKTFYKEMLQIHKQFDNEIWFAGGAWSWMGFAPKNDLSLATMKPAMSVCRDMQIENILITMWGDNGKECSFYGLLPALYAIRRFYDGVTDMRTIKSGFEVLTGEKFDVMKALDLPNKIAFNKKSMNGTLCKHALYGDPFLGFLDSTMNEEWAKTYKKYARRLSRYAKESKYEYIFETLAQLCRTLSYKLGLGIRSRKVYQAKDMEALKLLIADYKRTEIELKRFIKLFRELWFRENKPHGFEVQEQRLGGLLLRMASCRIRLEDYLEGRIENIPELEEKLLDFYGNEEDFLVKNLCYNKWGMTISPNII